MNQAVFLDRDGVISKNVVKEGRPYAPTLLKEFEYLPGVKEALERLKKLGFFLVVVTNQPDVRTGKTSRETVEAMNKKMCLDLPIDDVKVCYHVDADQCSCRKPKAGMLLEAAKERLIDLENSFIIGDRWRDVESGKAAGCQTIFLDYSYNEKQPEAPDYVVKTLPEAAELIVQITKGK